jgi:ketosteroid isomerase-like protein
MFPEPNRGLESLRQPQPSIATMRTRVSFDNPIQIPVTGHEDCGDQREAMQALGQFYRALNSRNLELMQQNWANSAEASMDNPLGGIKRGWTEIKTTYEKLFGSAGKYRFEFYDYTLHEGGDLFYVVGRERGELELGGRRMQLAIRTTRVFRRDAAGRWRQVHHHGSIDDSQMLSSYQEAILGGHRSPGEVA